MNLSSKLKREIDGFSSWFKIFLVLMFAVYIFLWFFTIHLSGIQRSKGMEAILPGAPKDAQEYILFSESLISDHGLSVNGRIETLRTPGYPFFAAVIKSIGRSYFAVTLVQILLVFGSALIIRRIGMVFASKKIGEIAATLLLINPVTMVLSLLIMTDILFLFIFSLAVYRAILLEKEKWLLQICIVSLLFVLAIYVRGMGLFAIPVFISPILASRSSRKIQMKSVVIMILFIVVCLTPWVVRNYVETGVASFNSFESVNLSWIVPKFLASANGTDEGAETLAFQKATGVPEEAWQDFGWHDIRYSKQINAVGEKIILNRPFSYLKFHVITSVPFLFPSSILFMREAYDSATGVVRPFKYGAINSLTSGDWKSFYQSIREVWWKFTERILWFFGLILAAYAVWTDRKNPLVWLFVFITGYLMLLAGPAAGPRLSLQAWPYMFMLFASGGVSLFKKLSRIYSKVG